MEIGGVEPLAVFAFDERWPPGSRVVAEARPLDLDDVSAEVGERLASPGTGEDARKLENFEAGKRFQGALLRGRQEFERLRTCAGRKVKQTQSTV